MAAVKATKEDYRIVIERIGAMNTEITNSGTASATGKAASQRDHVRRQPGPGPLRYGLPCENCKLYYQAELAVCPICGCGERMSPATDFAHLAAML